MRPDNIREYHRNWYHKNKESISSSVKRRRDRINARVVEHRNESRENKVKWLIRLARIRARKLGLEFDITVEDLKPFPDKCPLLDVDIVYLQKSKGEVGKRNRFSPSIDRIDNSKGYIKGNVQVVSWRGNQLKNDATIEELEMLLKNLKKE